MSEIRTGYGSVQSVAASGLGTLAAANYFTSPAIDATANKPLDVLCTVRITCGTVSGNKQALVFVVSSQDNTAFDSLNTSNTDNTHDLSMKLAGIISFPANATPEQLTFSMAQLFGGVLPPYTKIVVKNDSGAAFTGAVMNYREIFGTVV